MRLAISILVIPDGVADVETYSTIERDEEGLWYAEFEEFIAPDAAALGRRLPQLLLEAEEHYRGK
jgi:hypothetical protein